MGQRGGPPRQVPRHGWLLWVHYTHLRARGEGGAGGGQDPPKAQPAPGTAVPGAGGGGDPGKA